MPETWNSSEKFNREAAQWDENPHRRALAIAVANAIITAARPAKSMHAMEFGCGTGLVTLEIAPLVHTLTAIDTSAEMLGVLHEKIRNGGISNIETIRIDLTAPSQHPSDAAKRFDLIYSSMTLHHIGDTQAFLCRISNMLSLGGRIALADLDREDGLFHDDPQEKVHHGFDRGELALLLEAAGFQSVKFETVHTVEKQNRTGKSAAYPLFLVTATKAAAL